LRVNLGRLVGELGPERVAGLLTVTHSHLAHPREIVDEYVRLGLNSIFIRPLSVFGFAEDALETLHYSAEQFVSFYKGAMDYILSLNTSGVRFTERYAQILLHSILTPFSSSFVDLSSPCGAGIGQVVYNYAGSVFTCDEGRMLGEMGDDSFRLGNVNQDNYEDIFLSDKLRIICMSSCNECLPGCSDCVYQPYCGTCPVYNHHTQGSIFGNFSTNERCRLHEELFDYLFELLESPSASVLERLVRF
jgi:radical SAM protein with 4Fe4S-binding SPASM domain